MNMPKNGEVRILRAGDKLIAKEDISDIIKCGDTVKFMKPCLGCGGIVVEEQVACIKDINLFHFPQDINQSPIVVGEDGSLVQSDMPQTSEQINAGAATAAGGTVEIERVLHAMRRFAALPMSAGQPNGFIPLRALQEEYIAAIQGMGLYEQYREYMNKAWDE